MIFEQEPNLIDFKTPPIPPIRTYLVEILQVVFDARDDADETLSADLAIVEVLGHHGGPVGLPVLVDVEAVDLLDVTVDGVGHVGGLIADLALEETPVDPGDKFWRILLVDPHGFGGWWRQGRR